MKKIFFLFIILFYTPTNSAEVSKKEWNKKFPNVSYPKDNCEKCSRAHADWAYGWYRKATLMNRDYKSNGGLKSLNFNKSKNPSKIKKNINILPKNIFDFVNNRDIMSLMVYENGELIYDWKRDYVDNSKPINGESRSKSIVGVVIATLKCQNKIDLNKNHSFYTKELKDSEEMVKTAKNLGLVLKCGFNHRHHPAISEAKKLLEAGTIGKPLFLSESSCAIAYIIWNEYKDKLVYLMSVEKARFRNPVMPDCELHLDIEAVRSHGRVWKYKGVAKVNDKKMADAEWSATIVDRNK